MSDLVERLDEILRLGLTVNRAPAIREAVAEIENLRSQLVKERQALWPTFKALKALKEAVERSGSMNGRENVLLGIQVNALNRAERTLSIALTDDQGEKSK